MPGVPFFNFLRMLNSWGYAKKLNIFENSSLQTNPNTV